MAHRCCNTSISRGPIDNRCSAESYPIVSNLRAYSNNFDRFKIRHTPSIFITSWPFCGDTPETHGFFEAQGPRAWVRQAHTPGCVEINQSERLNISNRPNGMMSHPLGVFGSYCNRPIKTLNGPSGPTCPIRYDRYFFRACTNVARSPDPGPA